MELEEADHWEINFHEAAIFLEEGENNEKFDSHPRHSSDLPAYLMVHNNWYYRLDLTASLILLALALAEEPAVSKFTLPLGIHGTLELVALGIITIGLVLKLQWTGYDTVLKHKRTCIKCIVLIIMVLEAIVLQIRQESHFRVTRALRPIFLIDSRVCRSVRRFIRQIFQSLPPIIDMLCLLLFFVCSYAILGYYLFGDHYHNPYFRTLFDSFVSMFVLLTTANFPEVMMPSYAISKWNALFFICYISTVGYILTNFMLAVVYETFTKIEKDKFRKLLLHKKQACKLAFRLLVSKQNPDGIKLKQFEGLMRYYSPRKSRRDIVLMFKQLNLSGSGSLTIREFLEIYDVANIKWHLKDSSDACFESMCGPLKVFCTAARDIVSWKYFEYIVYVLIIGNGVAMLIRLTQTAENLEEGAVKFGGSWDTYLFITLFLVEALLRIIGNGWTHFITSGWNVFDLCVTLAALLGSIIIIIKPTFTIIVILRPLRLIRLFKLKKRFRDIFGTLVLLSPLMWSTAVVMILMYYFFAIIGMELFSKHDLRNCCVNTTVEEFFKYSEDNTTSIGFYYLNNFNDLLTTGVTLFELTVVNNWFIIMDAFASITNQYTRLYFMLFYLLTMVVLTILVASILEAFKFRIQFKRQTSKKDEEQMLHEEVCIEWNSLSSQIEDPEYLEGFQKEFCTGSVLVYVGRRPHNKDVLQRRMYISEIEKWFMDADSLEMDLNLKETHNNRFELLDYNTSK